MREPTRAHQTAFARTNAARKLGARGIARSSAEHDGCRKERMHLHFRPVVLSCAIASRCHWKQAPASFRQGLRCNPQLSNSWKAERCAFSQSPHHKGKRAGKFLTGQAECEGDCLCAELYSPFPAINQLQSGMMTGCMFCDVERSMWNIWKGRGSSFVLNTQDAIA